MPRVQHILQKQKRDQTEPEHKRIRLRIWLLFLSFSALLFLFRKAPFLQTGREKPQITCVCEQDRDRKLQILKRKIQPLRVDQAVGKPAKSQKGGGNQIHLFKSPGFVRERLVGRCRSPPRGSGPLTQGKHREQGISVSMLNHNHSPCRSCSTCPRCPSQQPMYKGDRI